MTNNEHITFALLPGGFKPPHLGHYKAAKYFEQSPSIDKVIIFISPKERAGHSVDERVVITSNMSLQLWNIFTKEDNDIEIRLSTNNSPVKEVFDFIESAPENSTILLGVGDKEGKKDERFKNAQKYADEKKQNVRVKKVIIPSMAKGISGTTMRNKIAQGEKEFFQEFLPQHLSQKEKDECWEIVSDDEQVLKEVSEFQRNSKRKHPARKKRLIGMGGQENSGPYLEKPSMKKNKSAPPGAGGQ